MKSKLIPFSALLALYAMALIYVVSLAAGAPTTLPTTNPVYLQGWVDAGGLVASTQPTTNPASQPAIASVPPLLIPAGIDIGRAINAAPAGSYFMLTPAQLDANNLPIVNYSTAVIINPPANFTLDVNGACLSLSGPAATSSNFSIHALGVTIFGPGTIAAGNVVFRNYSPTTFIHDLSAPDNACATFFLNDIGGAGATLLRCTVGKTSSETVYVTSGLITDSCTLYGSTAQDTWRQSPATDGSIPTGSIVRNCLICPSGILNPIHNEALSCRAGDLEVDDTTIGTWARAGQVNTPGVKIGANVHSIVFNRCSFPNVLQGFNAIQVSQGVSATINNCTFCRDGNSVPISVVTDGTSNCFINNCTVMKTVRGMKVKAYTFAPNMTPANPMVSESGTITLDPPLPATLPTTWPATLPATNPAGPTRGLPQ